MSLNFSYAISMNAEQSDNESADRSYEATSGPIHVSYGGKGASLARHMGEIVEELTVIDDETARELGRTHSGGMKSDRQGEAEEINFS
jgi:hypothetical protein